MGEFSKTLKNFQKSAGSDYWKKSMAQISRAFRLKTPAIVTSHRVNYIGSIFESNRKRGLSQLEHFLRGICSRWPDVHFLNSSELGFMIEHGLNSVKELEGRENEVFPSVKINDSHDRFQEESRLLK